MNTHDAYKTAQHWLTILRGMSPEVHGHLAVELVQEIAAAAAAKLPANGPELTRDLFRLMVDA